MSEWRRRNRISEKMRALQELVPHWNKTDKTSILDEAIEYLKSLQMQFQAKKDLTKITHRFYFDVEIYGKPAVSVTKRHVKAIGSGGKWDALPMMDLQRHGRYCQQNWLQRLCLSSKITGTDRSEQISCSAQLPYTDS